MKLAKVIGHVVATSKHPALAGRTILVLRPSPDRGDASEPMQLAIDGVGAGPKDEVLISESGMASRQLTGITFPPVRSVIVGIVD